MNKILKKVTDNTKDLCLLEFSGKDVINIYREFSLVGIDIIIDGGWAVDAIIGKQTRKHSDLDIIISIKEIESVKKVLSKKGFVVDKKETEIPNRLVLINKDYGLVVDCHLVAFQKDGSGVQDLINYRYVYSKEGLSGKGKILNEGVKCLSASEQMRCRIEKNYSFDDPDRFRPGEINADRHDLDLLKNLPLKRAEDGTRTHNL